MAIHAHGQQYVFLPAEDFTLHRHTVEFGGRRRSAVHMDLTIGTRGWRPETVVWALPPTELSSVAEEARRSAEPPHLRPLAVAIGSNSLVAIVPDEPLPPPGGWIRLGVLPVPEGFVQVSADWPGPTLPIAALLLSSDPDFAPSDDLRGPPDLAARFSDPTGTSQIEPATAGAGDVVTLAMTYRVGEQGLDPGGAIRVSVMVPNWAPPTLADPESPPYQDYHGGGGSWRVWNDPRSPGYVTVKAARRVRVGPIAPLPDANFPREHWVIIMAEERFEPGETITVRYGDCSGGGPGVTVPSVPLRYDRNYKYCWYHHLPPLTVWVDCRGTGSWVPLAPGHCHYFEVTAAPPAALRVAIPSHTTAGEPFPVRVVVLDHFDSPGYPPFQGTLRFAASDPHAGLPPPIQLTPGDAGVAWATATLHTAGVHRLHVVAQPDHPAAQPALSGESNPSRCRAVAAAAAADELFWGEIHAHCRYSDGVRSVDDLFRHGRDVAALDFCAAADHTGYITDAQWHDTQLIAGVYYDPGRFVTLVGYETGDRPRGRGSAAIWQSHTSGHRCIYARGATLPLFRRLEAFVLPPRDDATVEPVQPDFLSGLYAALGAAGPFISIPHHTLATTRAYAPQHPQVERLVEIYSQWGSSEYRGNPQRPGAHLAADAVNQGLSVRELLATGARLGFIGGSDNHDARPGLTGNGAVLKGVYPNMGYRGGLAAVYAPALTREAIFDALLARRTYATTGERILLEFAVNGVPMGQEATVPESAAPREVTGWVAGTAPITELVLVRDGEEIHRETRPVAAAPAAAPGEPSSGDPRQATFRYADRAPLPKTGASYYYLRVTQADGNLAWSSPVWITVHASAA